MKMVYALLLVSILAAIVALASKKRKRRREAEELRALVAELEDFDENACICCNVDPNASQAEPLDIPEEGILRLLLDMEDDLAATSHKKKA